MLGNLLGEIDVGRKDTTSQLLKKNFKFERY